jgi:hypothetical protein
VVLALVIVVIFDQRTLYVDPWFEAELDADADFAHR